jgi:DNA polymerase III sliding clamp (beta) subunit (PCNA family)
MTSQAAAISLVTEETEATQPIQVDAMELYRAIRATAVAMGDKDRVTLHGVYIEVKESTVCVVGTNGSYMMKYTIETEEQQPKFNAYIDGSSIKLLLSWLKDQVGIINVCETSMRSALGIIHFQNNDYKFPDYEQVIPRMDAYKGVSAIGLSCKYIADISKAYKAASPRSEKAPSICMSFGDDCLDPIRITSKSVPQLLTILMPVRL